LHRAPFIKAPTNFDTPNHFSLSENLKLPGIQKSNAVVRQATDGWVVSGSVILQSGTLFTAYTSASFQPIQDANGNVTGYKTGSGDYNGDGKNYDFPNAPAAGYSQPHDRQSYLKRLFPASAFTLPALGTEGNELSDTGTAAQQPGDAPAYWAQHAAIEPIGVDGWWPDEGDKLSVYARLDRNRMYFEGSRALQPDRRPFALHRNGYAGLQRYGWLWSGDTFSTWAALRAQIMIGINAGLCGIPYWGTDTGGFVPTPELTPELYVRWFQWSAFCPSFRSHGRAWKLRLPWGWGTGDPGPKEIEGNWVAAWPVAADLHRADVEEICRKFLETRYRLLPYLYSSVAQTHRTGIPLIRAMCLAYPQDPRAALIDDAYLWGDLFLVAPVHDKAQPPEPSICPQAIGISTQTTSDTQAEPPSR